MGAVVITPDPAIAVAEAGFSNEVLALNVAAGTMLVIGAGYASVLVERRTIQAGDRRMRQMADATLEGIVIVSENRIVDVNRAMVELVGLPRQSLIGMAFMSRFIALAEQPSAPDGRAVEGQVLANDANIPVEVHFRRIRFDDRFNDLYALRDLRERRDAETRIRFLADHDVLTGLYNQAAFRRQLAQTLEEVKAEGSAFALLRMDLDRFREINDLWGHRAGDEALRLVAARLKAAIGDDATVSRQGGDEFFILQRRPNQPQDAADLAQAVLDCLDRPVHLDGKDISVGASLGIAIYPEDGGTAEALLSNADMALARAKNAGRGTACFFEAATDEDVRERRVLAFELGRAVSEDRISVHFQPQRWVADGTIYGFEALARWHHPRYGEIPPSRFVAIAEECGLIGPLGERVLRAACREAASWPQALPIAVNLSPLQLKQADLADTVRGILLETGLAPRRLELEVTESALIHDMQGSLDVLRRLKAFGIRIVMDDFGTGYSSLSTFQTFPFDKIKIDRSFVAAVQTRHQAAAIVRAVVALARNLSIPVIAEGIETEGQLAFLASEECDIAQGYLLGKPAPIERYRHLTHAAPAQTGEAQHEAAI